MKSPLFQEVITKTFRPGVHETAGLRHAQIQVDRSSKESMHIDIRGQYMAAVDLREAAELFGMLADVLEGK